MRRYHKAKAAANNGRHDVAVQRFTEVRPQPDHFSEPAPLLPLRSACLSDVPHANFGFWIVAHQGPFALTSPNETQALGDCVLSWNEAKVITSIQVAKGLRLEIRRNEADTSSVLVAAHRRIVGEIISSQSESRLALGQIWLAMMDAEAGVDSAPELAETHLRLGAVYEAAGGNEPSLRAYQRAAQLDPKSVAVARGLERMRNTVVTPLGITPTGATPTLGPNGTPKLNGGGGSKGGKVFEMSLEQMDKEWEAIGLDCVKSQEWYNLRRKACPHGVLVAIVDAVENNDAMKAWKDEQLTENDITTEEYTEKEHFAERAMSLFAKKRHEGLPIPQDSTWLDLAFEAVNIDSLTPLEQAKICLCMANIFCWCGDFAGADELYTFALEMEDMNGADTSLAAWRPAMLANRALARMRVGNSSAAAVDAETALKEGGPRWGIGLARMGQVMCYMNEWAKAAQTFSIARERAVEKLDLKAKISLAKTAGVGVPAAKEAAAAAAERIQAGKEKEEMHVEFEALDRAVQLEAISAGEAPAESEPIMGPTPRFMSELTGTAAPVPDAPELSYGPDGSQRTGGDGGMRGRVRPLGSANLSAELLRLDEQTKSGREAKRKSGAAMSVSIGTDLRKETGDEVKQEPGAKNKLALESDLIASIVGSADKKKGEGHDLKRPRYNACGGIAKWADQVYKDYGPPDICGLFKAGGKDVADAHKEAAKGTGDMFAQDAKALLETMPKSPRKSPRHATKAGAKPSPA